MSTKLKLQTVHDKLTDLCLDILTEGVPVKDDETGQVHKGPPQAAFVAQIRQFLKDNNIEALATPGSKMASLATKLPFAGTSEYDDEHPTH